MKGSDVVVDIIKPKTNYRVEYEDFIDKMNFEMFSYKTAKEEATLLLEELPEQLISWGGPEKSSSENSFDELTWDIGDEFDLSEVDMPETDDDLDEFDDESESLIDSIVQIGKMETIQEEEDGENRIHNGKSVIYYHKKVEENVTTKIKNLHVETYGTRGQYEKIQKAVLSALKHYKEPDSETNDLEIVNGESKIVTRRIYYTDEGKLTQTLDVKKDVITSFSLVNDEFRVVVHVYPTAASPKNSIQTYIRIFGFKPKKVTYKDVNKQGILTYNRDNMVGVNFPEVDYFKSFLHLDYVDKADYKIIDDEEGLQWLKAQIDALPMDHVIAYDAETTGLNFHKWIEGQPIASELVTHSFSWADDQAVIVPVRMKTVKNITLEQNEKYIKPILENRRILCHNGAADFRFNLYDKIDLNLCEDTMVMAKHLMPYLSGDENSSRSKTRSSLNRKLSTLLDRAFKEDKIDLNRYVFKPLGLPFDFSILPEEYLIVYGCPDTDRLRKLYNLFAPKLDNTQLGAYYEMVKFSKVMAEMSEWAGMKLSEEIMVVGREKQKKLLDTIGKIALASVGEDEETLKLSSSAEIANFLYSKLGVPITKDTKRTSSGRLAADKNVLKELGAIKLPVPSTLFKDHIYTDETKTEIYISKEELNSLKYPFCRLLLEWRDIYKNITSYYDSLMASAIQGIYYESFRVGSTDTWRTIGRIQTTKGELKDGILPYGDDWGVFCMDFSSQELRVASNLGKDLEMYEVLKSPEADAHRSVAASLFGKKPYLITHQERKMGKIANFLLLYGGGAGTLASSIYGGGNLTKDQLAEAQRVYDAYYRTYSKMTSALVKYRLKAGETAWVQNELGFRMIYDDFLDIEEYENQVFDPDRKRPPEIVIDPVRQRMYGYKVVTAAGNYPIQSYAGGLLMILGNKLYDEFNKRGYRGKVFIPLVVHDEVNIFYHKSISPFEILEVVKGICEVHYNDPDKVPLYIGAGFGNSWGEAKSDKAELPVLLQDILVNEWKTGTYDKSVDVTNAQDYFFHRKVEYIRERLQKELHFVFETKTYNTAEVIKALRIYPFLLTQGSDLFGMFNSKTTEYKHDIILDTILKGTGIDKSEIKFVEEEIKDDVSEEDSEVPLYFHQTVHPRVYMSESYISIDITNLPKETVKNLVEYLHNFNEDDRRSLDVRLVLNGKLTEPIQGLKIRTLPLNIGKKLQQIFIGKSLEEVNKKDLDTRMNLDVEKFFLDKGKAVAFNIFLLGNGNKDNMNKEFGIVLNKLAKFIKTSEESSEELIPILIVPDKNNPNHAFKTKIFLKENVTAEIIKDELKKL